MLYKVKTYSNNPFTNNIELSVKAGVPMTGYRLRSIEPLRDGADVKEVDWYNNVLSKCLVSEDGKKL